MPAETQETPRDTGAPTPAHGSSTAVQGLPCGLVLLWGGPFRLLEACLQHPGPTQHPARHDSQNHLQTSPCGPRAACTEIPALTLRSVSRRVGREECAPASGLRELDAGH